MKKGIEQLSEEGVIQAYHITGTGDRAPVVGAVGVLQFEILQYRMQEEYNVKIDIERLPHSIARWVQGSKEELDAISRSDDCMRLQDRDELDVILFKTEWSMGWAKNHYKNLTFLQTSPMTRAKE